jgi:Fe2+ or Zn2+ uptake regulation protein
MVRHTSKQVFKQINDEGLLSQKRLFIYRELYKHGPATANELYKKGTYPDTSQANIYARLNELRERGVATEITERKCDITNRKAIVWDVTAKLPKDFKADTVTNREKMRRLRAASNYALKVFKLRGKQHYDLMQDILAGR